MDGMTFDTNGTVPSGLREMCDSYGISVITNDDGTLRLENISHISASELASSISSLQDSSLSDEESKAIKTIIEGIRIATAS